MIQTITQKIAKRKLQNKFVLAHEHLNFDLRHIRQDEVSWIKNEKLILQELARIPNQQIGLIVDLSNQSMQPDKNALIQIQKASRIKLVTATGYYLNAYESNNQMSVKELETEFYHDITNGFKAAPKVKAGIIGEIATSSEKIFPFEEKVFRAAVKVQKRTNVAIYTHVNLGANILAQVNLLNRLDAKPQKIIIGHLDLATDIKLVKNVLQQGYNIGIDTIGKQNYVSDLHRAQVLVDLINSGFEDQIVISLDISKQDYLTTNGGHGYGYIVSKFYHLVCSQITTSQWEKVFRENILRILDL